MVLVVTWLAGFKYRMPVLTLIFCPFSIFVELLTFISGVSVFVKYSQLSNAHFLALSFILSLFWTVDLVDFTFILLFSFLWIGFKGKQCRLYNR